ncbi:hypothetical protein AYR56_05420 [Loigolactobacillus backii]|uniref:Uncharacterized protein n=1 Tax=Loigolactobacillus backii TaxID=375175 RepID=A0A192H4P9_9LACO|nr:hypothetical protein [Loigolactobacillus backii]ANK63355.1 hypothetical protein AYR53_11585 [Loigolactobacillus backii]ANK69640.1 hypothetical protein AYR56_05420 [Loigolactobacillus backii]
MKTIYRNDTINKASGFGVFEVDENYELQAGETFSSPPIDAKTPLTILEDGTWQSATADMAKQVTDDYISSDDYVTVPPTPEQQTITALAKQNADLSAENANLKQHVTSIEQTLTAIAVGGA